MIEDLKIQRFKSLREVELSLGQVNVFVGANGSGKSNLLEAVGFWSAASSGTLDAESLVRRGVRAGRLGQLASHFSSAPQGGDWVEVEGKNREARYRVKAALRGQAPRQAWHFEREVLEDGPAGWRLERSEQGFTGPGMDGGSAPPGGEGIVPSQKVKLDPSGALSRLLRHMAAYTIYAPTTPVLRDLWPDAQLRPPVGVSGGGLEVALWELLEGSLKIEDEDLALPLDLVEWVDRVTLRDPRFGGEGADPAQSLRGLSLHVRDRYLSPPFDWVNIQDVSEGILYVLFHWVLAVHPQAPPLLAVDNVDAVLHPRLARELMSRICGWVLGQPEKQLLVTAHNPPLLDALPLQDDRVRLFVVDRTNQGDTCVRRIEVDDALMSKVKDGWTLSRLWVMGHLGGVPHV